MQRYFDIIHPEMCKVDPKAFSPDSKQQVYRSIQTWHAYGIFVPPFDAFIGAFRRHWPIRQVCTQVLDMGFSECSEIIAEIDTQHTAARRLFELVGAEYVGMRDRDRCYRMTAAMRKPWAMAADSASACEASLVR
jgi:hypothetical protein